MNYGINDIETLSFKEGVRKRVAMYLGSADMQGVYNGIQEIISNSVDEFFMGFGKEITIDLQTNNYVLIQDNGRGIPFGIKEDGSNVLVDIFSRPHTGGKFNDKTYNSVAGLNGIGAKATCLSSESFKVISVRDGLCAEAKWQEGDLVSYEEKETKEKNGTIVSFKPSPLVFNLEEVSVAFEELCNKCKSLSYLTQGLSFILTQNGKNKKVYRAENGLVDLVKENKNGIHGKPIYCKVIEGHEECEVALLWTKGREKSYTFTNGLENVEGGTSLTGVKTSITNFMKKQFKNGFNADLARTGLVYAISCKTPNPSFANQTKTKINNPSLRGLAQQTTTKALSEFAKRFPLEFEKIIDFLGKEQKAELAAERARKKVLEATKDIEKNQKRKVFASDKLKDAEFLGQDATLLLVEGDAAGGAVAKGRDYKKYGILSLRGKMINALSNPEEKIYNNEEIKLFLSAMNIIPNRYDGTKLRYGKIGICTDADSDK